MDHNTAGSHPTQSNGKKLDIKYATKYLLLAQSTRQCFGANMWCLCHAALPHQPAQQPLPKGERWASLGSRNRTCKNPGLIATVEFRKWITPTSVALSTTIT